MARKNTNLIDSRRLARNVLWNLLGAGAPLLVAIIAIPILIEGLGTPRFGVLTLAWMVVGYFSLFDLGLGRALTKLVAEKLGEGQNDQIPSLVWTALSLMAVLGVLTAILFAVFSPWVVLNVLNIPAKLQSETLTASYLLAASIPIVIVTTGVRGVLEAHQRFGLVNAIRMPLGLFTFLGPLAVLPFFNSLVAVVAVLVIARLLSGAAYFVLCLSVEPTLYHSLGIHRAMVRPLINFGGWMTVSNIISALMVYVDRFFIGAMVSMTAVAYYATPYEIVTKLWIVSGALLSVAFPAFTSALVHDRARATYIFDRAVTYIFITHFPIIFVIIVFANEGLTLWLGSEFSDNSSLVLQLLAVGVFVNGYARIPFVLIQSEGRPDIAAKLHLAELPVYSCLLWWLLDSNGIVGAAIAWLLRAVIDAVLLFSIARRILPAASSFSIRAVPIASMVLVVLSLGVFIHEIFVKWVVVFLVLGMYCLYVWFVMLTTGEKEMVQRTLKGISGVK